MIEQKVSRVFVHGLSSRVILVRIFSVARADCTAKVQVDVAHPAPSARLYQART